MKISVIIPCYNVEKYIKDTINSVLSQTYKDYELILINDGSTDKTLNILEEMHKIDNRIKIFNQKNKGVSEARNLGISLANGEFIYFLDGDDIVHLDMFEIAENIFSAQNVDMFSFGYQVKDVKSTKKYSSELNNRKIFSSTEFLNKILNKEIYQHICSFLIKRKFLSEIKFDKRLIIGEDLDFQLRLLLNKEFLVYYTSTVYFDYMKRGNSATTLKKVPNNYFYIFDSLDKLKSKMLDRKMENYKDYHIERFFFTLFDLSGRKMTAKQYEILKNKLKKYDYILKDLKFKLNKKSII